MSEIDCESLEEKFEALCIKLFKAGYSKTVLAEIIEDLAKDHEASEDLDEDDQPQVFFDVPWDHQARLITR